MQLDIVIALTPIESLPILPTTSRSRMLVMALARKTSADPPPASHVYETDLVAWAEANAALLRQGRVSEIDALHIAEELEDVGKSERRSLASHLRNLLVHLLKWRCQEGLRRVSWRLSIQNARLQIQDILADSPSLKARVAASLEDEYRRALVLAATETGLPKGTFPADCPFSAEQVLDEDWWPEASGF